jgi:hypothetical protein
MYKKCTLCKHSVVRQAFRILFYLIRKKDFDLAMIHGRIYVGEGVKPLLQSL